jgi:hypothetical protein
LLQTFPKGVRKSEIWCDSNVVFCMSAMGLGCVKTRRRSIAIEEVIRPRPF